MTRYIICNECGERMQKTAAKHPEEPSRFMTGEALDHCTCDGCGKPIVAGTSCVAGTVVSANRLMPPAWEHEFLVNAE